MVQSVSRAVRLLELVAEHPGEMGVTELGRRLGVHKATAFRLLATLAESGLVEQDPDTDKYRPGFGVVRLAAAAAGSLDLVRQARPVLQRLAEATKETVNLAVLDGDQVVNVDQVEASHAVVHVNWVGRRTPLHCTSNGKILLAHLSEAEQQRFLGAPLEPRTPKTIVDPGRLRSQLEQARLRGYAYTVEELEVGLNAVAAPIRDADGAVAAAVSVAGPAYRVTRSRTSQLARETVLAAADISRRMGYLERRESVVTD